MKKLLFNALISTLTIFYSAIIYANDHESLTVVTEEWPPYNYLSAAGKVVGEATEVVENTLQTVNIPYSLNIYPWARAYKMALENPNVLIYSIIKTQEREKLFHWLCPLMPVSYAIFKLSSRTDIKINSFDDMKKYTLGISRGSFFHQILTKNGFVEGQHYHTTGDNLANLRQLFHQRVDIIADSQNSINRQLNDLSLAMNDVQLIYQLPEKELGESCMAFSLKTPKTLVDKVRTSYQKLYLNK
jgi:polar amino acid transport system substrate-binding protein